ncbi:MAG TPA: ABC transporter permease, partial [Phycisphaerae bacterium]|nr:ABC transporter permease [Phycisphaerae bacterium]
MNHKVIDRVIPEGDMTALETTLVDEVKPAEAEADELVIRPVRGWIGVDWAEIVRYRELLYFLVWRDLKVRYKQTVLGVAWAVLQPLFNMLLFWKVSQVAGFSWGKDVNGNDSVVQLCIYAGLLPWTFFSTGVNLGGLSLINQSHLLTKVYFPRLFVPTASIAVGLADMAISAGMFVLLLLYYGFLPSWQVVFVPCLVLMTMLVTLGFGYLLASLTVSYRDFRYVIPFLVQAMMIASAVMFPLSNISADKRWIWSLNPMVGIVDAFRSALLRRAWDYQALGISGAVTVCVFVVGLYYLR